MKSGLFTFIGGPEAIGSMSLSSLLGNEILFVVVFSFLDRYLYVSFGLIP